MRGRRSLARVTRAFALAVCAFALWTFARGLAEGQGDPIDASASDASIEDAGTSDAGREDAGIADAGVADAGPTGTSLSEVRASAPPVGIVPRLISLVGLAVMVGLAWLLSLRRDKFPWRLVGWGVGLQLVFGVFVLKTPVGLALFAFLNDVVGALLGFTADGSRFLFGAYLDSNFTVALNVLPTIIFFSSLMAVLYHLGVMQKAVRGVAWVMQRTLKTSGAETLSAAANIFVGQTEAPLVVKPFVKDMTMSELMAVMTGGFATVAGGVLAAYVGMLREHFPDIAGHLIAASVMSAPASIVIAKVILPETEEPKTAGTLELEIEKTHANVIDAAAAGAGEGLTLALNVGAMLLAFLALVAMVNWLCGLPTTIHNGFVMRELAEAWTARGDALPDACASADWIRGYDACARALDPDASLWAPWTLERMLGYVFWPIAFVMGTPVDDCSAVAALLGEKLILNEFVAYSHLSQQLTELSPRAIVIATYALCGFANLGSIGIQLGGIGGMAPERRGDLARIGVRAMLAGTLACFMTACVAGILV
ncbi:MAG: NupC/NupG family nucleoside CNT transporter [Sandaracinaceae bacterium]